MTRTLMPPSPPSPPKPISLGVPIPVEAPQPLMAEASRSVIVPRGVPVRRFTVDEYHRMIAEGYFERDERFELLDGLIVPKMSRDPIHDACLAQARRMLDVRLGPGWHVRVQSAVTTHDSEPEPDLAIVRGAEFDYVARHPNATDAALIVEVANTSHADDRGWKGAIYARAGFAVYWLLNVKQQRVEVYSDPSGPDAAAAYRRREDYPLATSVPLMIGGVAVEAVAVDQLLPPIPQAPTVPQT